MIPIFSSHSAIPGDDSLIQVQLQYPEGTGSKSIRACIFLGFFYCSFFYCNSPAELSLLLSISLDVLLQSLF